MVRLKNSTLWWEGRWPSWSGIGIQVIIRGGNNSRYLDLIYVFKLFHFTTISCHCM